MRNVDIKRRIDENNVLIESLIKPNVFTLNNTIAELLAENRELQSKCEHDFNEEGICDYCYLINDDNMEEK